MKPTLHESITKEFEEIGSWEFAGKVARKLSPILQTKESNLERRMRELYQKGVLERRLVKIEGIVNKVVSYKIRDNKPFWEKPVFQKQEEVKSLFT